MTARPLPAQRIADLVGPLLAGRHEWGAISATVDRWGRTRYRLSVFPPGIGADRRLRLRMWRALPYLAVALLLPALVVGHVTGGMGETFFVAGILIAVLGVVLARAASPERALVRESWAMGGDASLPELRRHLDILCRAESARSRGRLSEDEYLQIWTHVYVHCSHATR